MAINRVEIKNFTVFNDVSIDFNSGINVIIGENGTGKTHLLKLIYAFCLLQKTSDLYSFKFKIEEMFASNDTSNLFNFNHDKIDIVIEDNKKIYKISITKENYFEIADTKEYIIPAVFIPAKEMLSMSNITRIHDKYSKELSLDKTLLDIIRKSQNIKPNNPPELAKNIISKLEKIIDGEVFVKNDNSFWIRKSNQSEIPFSMEAEGLRKFGLLWQLIMNESITDNTVLLWDEPEANINPKLIPDLVEMVLELSRNGVQVFISTHDYILAKYFEVKRKENDSVRFHSLYKTNEGVKCESNINFRDLNNNSIIIAFDELMDEVINRNMGD